MSQPIKSIGIIGAGKLGITLAQLALSAGYRVLLAGSSDPAKIALTAKVLAPGSEPVSSREAAEADIIILALPLGKFRNIASDMFDDKLVIDAMNHWWEVDGPRQSIMPDHQTSSQAVQQHFPKARIVKALNHMGYHHLHDEARTTNQPDRKAIAIAGDNRTDSRLVEQLIDNLGFDPLYIGELNKGSRLEAGSQAFGANVEIAELKRITGVSKPLR